MGSQTRLLVVLALGTAGCGAGLAPKSEAEPPPMLEQIVPMAPMGGAAAAPTAADSIAPPIDAPEDDAMPLSLRRAGKEVRDLEEEKEDGDQYARDKTDEGKSEGKGTERTRSWFPEAFLWQPELVTSADGTAQLDVTVPDQLTTWRVLALAHDGRGQQAGTVHSFDSTLPLYVDPVVPGWLYTGDRVVLPVQVVNTTDQSLPATVTVEASGAITGAGTAQVTLGPAGSDVRALPFEVSGAGTAKITARLSSSVASDAAERVIPVIPSGRPVETQRGGTLASSRTFQLPAPAGADPTTEQIEVVVFPGALSVLQLELERLSGGARPDDAAYGFALTGAIAKLAERAKVELDDAQMRKNRLLAWQRVVPSTRAPDPGTAADLLTSLREVEDHPQAEQLLPRLRHTVRQAQRADGTWSRSERSTLQKVLVDTAYAARALAGDEDGTGPRLRAQAAIERYLHEVKDPYTASVLLASDLVDGDSREALLKLLVEAIGQDEAGEPALSMPKELQGVVVNPWGLAPSRAELLAWAVLALPEDKPERGDLAAQLLRGWSATSGFGAGRGDTVALEATTRALGALSGPIDVSLAFDGTTVATATLDPSQPRVPARLRGVPTGNPEITVNTSQGVPGLAFVATRRSYLPWSEADRLPGVELTVESPSLRVGQETLLQLTAVAPSGSSLRIEQPLPSGVVVGEDAMQRVSALGGRLQVLSDRIVVVTRPFEPGEILSLSIPVTPSFAGRFQTAPVLISADGGAQVPLRPMVWTVAGGLGGS